MTQDVLYKEFKVHRHPDHGSDKLIEAGFAVPEICQVLGFCTALFYK